VTNRRLLVVFTIACLLVVFAGGVGGVSDAHHGVTEDPDAPHPGTTTFDTNPSDTQPPETQTLETQRHDEATDPDDGEEPDDGTLETTYFEIIYDEAYEAEADTIADVADDHYEVLHQKFGLEVPEERLQIFVGPRENQPCDAAGCVDPLNRVWVTSDSRSLLHHELVHTIQLRQHWSPLNALSPPDSGEGMFIEGTAKYLDSSPDAIAENARFDPTLLEMTPYPDGSTEYAERALFVEFILANHDRDTFDVLYLEGDVDALEAETGESYADLRAAFDDQLETQHDRLQAGGTPLPAFTYDVVEPEPGETITLDARTPEPVTALERSWYPEEPAAFEWDLTGDGEIDETGETATLEIPEGEALGEWSGEVTLTVTIDGETYTGTQPIVVDHDHELAVLEVITPDSAVVDDPFSTSVTVENQGHRTVSEIINLEVGDQSVTAKQVDLEGGEERAIDLEATLRGLEAGTYEVQIVGEESGVLYEGAVRVETVVADDTAADSDRDDELEFGDRDDAIPGGGIPAAVTAIGVVLVLGLSLARWRPLTARG